MSDKVVGKIFVTSWKNYKKFRKNGWDIEPITVNKDYVIISGHHRLAAAVQAEIDIKYTIADVDVANFAMLEFMHPSIPGAEYTPTGDTTCEIAGFGVNQLEGCLCVKYCY